MFINIVAYNNARFKKNYKLN